MHLAEFFRLNNSERNGQFNLYFIFEDCFYTIFRSGSRDDIMFTSILDDNFRNFLSIEYF